MLKKSKANFYLVLVGGFKLQLFFLSFSNFFLAHCFFRLSSLKLRRNQSKMKNKSVHLFIFSVVLCSIIVNVLSQAKVSLKNYLVHYKLFSFTNGKNCYLVVILQKNLLVSLHYQLYSFFCIFICCSWYGSQIVLVQFIIMIAQMVREG